MSRIHLKRVTTRAAAGACAAFAAALLAMSLAGLWDDARPADVGVVLGNAGLPVPGLSGAFPSPASHTPGGGRGGSVGSSGHRNDRTRETPNGDPERSHLNRVLVGDDRNVRERVAEIISEHGGNPRSDSGDKRAAGAAIAHREQAVLEVFDRRREERERQRALVHERGDDPGRATQGRAEKHDHDYQDRGGAPERGGYDFDR